MNVGIMGSGVVAKALASGFLKQGDKVMLGTRTPSKLVEWTADYPSVRIGSVEDAAAFGELLVLAVKGSAALDVLRSASKGSLVGKTVIDTTNPIADDPPVNGVIKFFTGPGESLMERLQVEFPGCHFVKAFNSVGNALMVNPSFEGGPPTMFICGNDEGAKKSVRVVLDQFGWETEDLGKAEAARAIEPLCILWCIPGFLHGRWTHAFKLLT